MNSRYTPFVVLALGVVVFGLGVVIRLHAADVGAAALAGGPGKMLEGIMDPSKGGYNSTMALAQRSNALYDVALPLLWTGGALAVLAAVAALFLPAWRFPQPAANPGHPILGELR